MRIIKIGLLLLTLGMVTACTNTPIEGFEDYNIFNN